MPAALKPKRAAQYLRVSTDRQSVENPVEGPGEHRGPSRMGDRDEVQRQGALSSTATNAASEAVKPRSCGVMPAELGDCGALANETRDRPIWWVSFRTVAGRLSMPGDDAIQLAYDCAREGLVMHDQSQLTKGRPAARGPTAQRDAGRTGIGVGAEVTAALTTKPLAPGSGRHGDRSS
jgi:hypothetical protein